MRLNNIIWVNREDKIIKSVILRLNNSMLFYQIEILVLSPEW